MRGGGGFQGEWEAVWKGYKSKTDLPLQSICMGCQGPLLMRTCGSFFVLNVRHILRGKRAAQVRCRTPLPPYTHPFSISPFSCSEHSAGTMGCLCTFGATSWPNPDKQM